MAVVSIQGMHECLVVEVDSPTELGVERNFQLLHFFLAFLGRL